MQFSITYYRKKHKYLLKEYLSAWHILIFLIISATLFFTVPSSIIAETSSVTYKENTDQELTIYFINGKEPGNTMMIIGGIQGDEPGGYLAADLYADMLLEKGNLIVVPRANFKSIILNKRGVNGDMNRKFAENSTETPDNDLYIVDTLKSLILKSDVLLNLHDGSGFFHPEYISEMQNPKRYGQSIIADASEFENDNGQLIDLKGKAERVIKIVNQNIKNEEHHFRFNNHDTLKDNSLHKEQRTSATYFALTNAGIPAFGVETSKSINLNTQKVKYQTLIINAFMTEYEIIPEHPSVFLPVPELDHLVVQVIGDQNPYAVKNDGTISITAGTSIHVSDIVANYKRGLSIDITGIGNTNDLGRIAVINNPATIKVYKDSFLCGKVNIEIKDEDMISTETLSRNRLKQIEILVDKKNVVVSEGDTLHIVRGDIIKITRSYTENFSQSGFRVNFVGFVGNKKINDAEDRGYAINTATDLLAHRSLKSDGSLYRIEVQSLKDKKVIGLTYLAIKEPKIEYIILETADGTKLAVTPDSILGCKKQDKFKIISIISNISIMPYIDTYLVNGNGQQEKLVLPAVLEISSETDIQFRRTQNRLGSISFRISG